MPNKSVISRDKRKIRHMGFFLLFNEIILQVRSKNIMATLEETKISFTKDEETNGLKCNVCNVCLNSIQQLQTHLNGNEYI